MSMTLVVDDNPDACQMLARLVRRVNGDAACVNSGEEALAYVKEHDVDLMILDMMMPDMDGLEVLRQLRADPKTKSLPVVMCSAIGDPEFKQHALQKGADEYWLKASFDFGQLASRLKHWLKVDQQQ